MTVISVDPGETVGWALWVDGELLDQGEYEWEEFLERLEELLQSGKVEVVVMEDYRLREKASKAMINSRFLTVQVIGVVKWLAKKHDVPVYLQLPALAKQFWDNDKLKKIGYYEKGIRHSRDAVRHGLYFFYNGEGQQFANKSLAELLFSAIEERW